MSRYTSKHTGSEIDAAIDRAKAGGTIDTLLAGKAPAGYGLGGTFGGYIADADNATVDGKYQTNSNTLNLPNGIDGMFGVIDVTTIRPDKALLQKFYPGTDGYPPYSLERRRIIGVWKPWEWVNPPMAVGVEYRTTERYMGKPVYVMVVDCGVAPSKSETWIKINKEISRFISIDAVSYASDTYQTTIPDSVESCKAVLVMSSQSPYILVKTTTDNFAVNGYHVYARIKYTKSTD